ncbi:ATPase GET3B [Physcomitrium patens]|uniref:ArsA/GET3 Anion-transporting ATPase-like domain-containing protein n=1 Tax=Physcomitrium patens TaxID=3218 RepID=A0A2K1IND9_PHYPA|nr:ATPase ARSA1-like [Physcomitrium patens]PNR30799.1 hypothetical protein PHYPA_027115 [Physcomitrium patens]|eukprot:XP_024361113.1 ATPase ARSA1-like [Physcomitrella patens]
MALCVAPLRVVGVESCLSGLSSGLRASAAPCSFAPLQFRALCPEEVGNYGFSSCALRSSGIKELSRPHLGYDLAARGRRKLDSLLTVAAVANPVEANRGFEEMTAGTTRKYFMLGGKGGVGKTSLAASLAVKFANNGHPTLVVSTDPAHSLSDSFAQDLSGGTIMAVDGVDFPLYAMEINPEQAREEFRASVSKDGGTGVKDFMDSVGLGGWVGELSELKLGELLDTPPPGLDEAMAISKVVQFIQSPEYSKFTRIIFDTAPTGHTLRLLSLPDFLDASIGKILKLKKKIQNAAAAIKSVFGQGDGRDKATDKLEALKERMIMVREIFRNKETTEFVIVTIPTVMAISESSRLKSSLEKEGVPVKRLIVNQVLPPSNSDCKFCAVKRKDQKRAMDMVSKDPSLQTLEVVESPLFDLEIRGVPALKFMGDLVWR